jgi:hypothetical protein
MIDISIQYYTSELANPAKNYVRSERLLVILSMYYCQLTMGICQSPDFAQEAMENLLQSFKEADVYIDAIGVFSHNWSDH